MMFTKKKKKSGLALGSGGAKGMAHLGVLRAFEEEGISFDVVAGTSIGSIVGAMYARGYSSTDTMELVKRLDYKNLAVSLLVGGSFAPVRRLLSDSLGTEAFDELKLPFAAVATDVSQGAEVVLRGGNLIDSLMASSAMPPFFRAVEIDGTPLADGAFFNAVPGDVVREMGADIVVGVGLSEYSEDKPSRFMTAGGQIVPVRQKGFAACDILLTPALEGYAATDILRKDNMYDLGYECARSRMEEVRSLLKNAKAAKAR